MGSFNKKDILKQEAIHKKALIKVINAFLAYIRCILYSGTDIIEFLLNFL